MVELLLRVMRVYVWILSRILGFWMSFARKWLHDLVVVFELLGRWLRIIARLRCAYDLSLP